MPIFPWRNPTSRLCVYVLELLTQECKDKSVKIVSFQYHRSEAKADNLHTIFPDKKTMPPEFYKFLEDLYHNKELLRPEQPAATYVRMTLEGIPTDAVGKVLDWDDQRIK